MGQIQRRRKRRSSGRRGMSRQERKIQLLLRMTGTVLLAMLVLGIFLLVRALSGTGSPETKQEETAAAATEPVTTPAPTPTPEAVQITVSAAGDCTLGTDEDFDYDSSLNALYYTVEDPSYFFSEVAAIFEHDDLTIVNLEGPLTTSEDLQEKTFSFKGDPDFVKILTAGSVEAVNLANNHSYDYGEQGYQDTIANVEAAGIASFGYERTALVEAKGIKIGLAGIYVLADGMEREEQLRQNIRLLKQQGAQLVIVSFHWGSEKENYPDDTQKALAHIAVDEGADLVLGHHPHVLQGIEHYKGKNIVYSLANFCFGGNSNPSDKDTMIFQQTFTVTGTEVAEDNVTNIIPCRISSASGYNNYQPIPVEGEEEQRVRGRIEEYSAGLGATDDSEAAKDGAGMEI